MFLKSPLSRRKASGRKGLFSKGGTVECLEARIAPAAAVLGVTKIAAFAPGGDLNNNGIFDPGDTILYTVTLTNNGGVDLTGVTLQDILDGNLTQGAVNVSPLATDDTFSAVANTQLRVGNPLSISGPSANVAGHVTDNDAEFLGDTFAISSFEGNSANGGSVSMVTSGPDAGSFSYLPAVGFTGTDTFHYTIKDKGLDGIAGNADDMTSVGTVKINVGAQKVWYVDNAYSGLNGASDGSSSRPFTSLSPLSTGGIADSRDGAGDIIFVHSGSSSYTSGIVLEASQTLHGQGTGLTVGGFNLVAAGTAPTLAPGTSTAITLSTDNFLKGFIVGDSQRDILGNGFGTLTVSNVTLNGTGKILDLTNGTFATGSAFNSVSTSGTSGLVAQGQGIQMTSVHGSVNFGSTTISGTEAHGIFVKNSDADITFGNTSVGSSSTSGVEGIHFETNTGGTRSFGTLIISASQSGGIGMSISDTAGTVSASGLAAISNVATTALSVSGGASVSFGTLNLSGIGGDGIVLNSHTGSFNTGIGGTIQTVNGIDVNIAGGTGAVTITEAITNTTGGFITIDNHETGNVTFSGNLSSTGGAGGISIINSNSGTFAFSGVTKTLTTNANAGITLTNNAGGTFNFSNGGLAITTTSGAGINATGGGTLSVTTGANPNTISSGTGTALTVSNTSIGSGNLNFRSISANGGANGIVLNTTGNAGGLIVTGVDGNADTIPDAGTGGTIQNTSGHGISLTNTENVRLGGMNIINNLGSGIGGTTVNGFLLNGVTITGNGNDAATDESGINIAELTGSAFGGVRPTGITNSTISNNNEFEIQITNTTGVLTDFHLTNNTISSNGVAINGNASSPHGNLVNFLALGTASMTLTTSGGTFTGNLDTTGGKVVTGTALNVDSSGTGSSVFASINGGTFQNNNVAVTVSTSQGGNLDFDIIGTTSTFSRSHALNLFVAASSTGTVTGTFVNNIIGTAGVENSGSEVGFGIRVQNEGSTSTANPVTVQISSNTIHGMGSVASGGFAAVNVNLGLASQTFTRTTNLTVTGNNIDDVYGNRAIIVQQNNTTAPGTVNATISGNDLGDNIAGNVGDKTVIRLRQLAGGTFNLTQTSVADLATVNTIGAHTTTTAEISTSGTITFGAAAPALPLQFAPSANDVVPSQGDTTSSSGGGSTAPAGSTDTPATTQPPAIGSGGTTTIVTPPPVIVDDGILSQSELDSLVGAAIARWEATGLTPAQDALLHSVVFSVEDLSGWYLGEAGAGHIVLDSNAAGNSWFIDTTPNDDSEFAGSGTKLAATAAGGAAGRIDALTVVMHELGHVLGLSDSYLSTDTSNLMHGFLHQGERRVPGAHQADHATPNLGAGELEFAVGPVNIGSLPVGKSVQIAFTGTIKHDISTNTITNQATASSDQTGAVLSDDPTVPGTANPTVTTVNLPDVSVAVSSDVAENSGGSLTYTFTRTGPNDFSRTINFSVAGTAGFSGDYTQSGADTFSATTGTVTFAAGSSTATVTLTPQADNIVELDETAVLTVTSGTGYDVGSPSAATGKILNDDSATVSITGSSVTEGDSATKNLQFTVSLSNPVDVDTTVQFSTADGTATVADNDYVGQSNQTVTILAGQTSATKNVVINGDTAVEADETFTGSIGTLGASGHNVSLGTTSATGSILNDDTGVAVAIGATNAVAEDGGNDLVYTFTRSGVTTGTHTANFSLTGSPTLDATDYSVLAAAGITFDTGTATGTVTFNAGETTKTVTVHPTADTTVESDEDVVLTVKTGTGYSPLGTPSTGKILNDDTSVKVELLAASSVAEDSGNDLVYTFTRSGVTTGTHVANFSLTGSPTLDGADYSVLAAAGITFDTGTATGTVTFNAGELTKTVTIHPAADSTVEPDEDVVLTVKTGTGYNPAGSLATGKILNDDSLVTVTVSPGAVLEDGTTNLVYTFTRSGFTGADMFVNFDVGGTAHYDPDFNSDYAAIGAQTFGITAGSVKIPAGQTTASVTIDPVADTVTEPDETVILTVKSGTGYGVGSPSLATGTILNDDTHVTLSVQGSDGAISASEHNGTLTYHFTRDGDTTQPLTVNFNVNNLATFITDYTQSGAATFGANSGTVTIPAGQTTANVVLTAVDDTIVEGSESVGLTLTAGSGYQVSGQVAQYGYIADNDTAVAALESLSSSVGEAAGSHDVGVKLVITGNGVVGDGTLGGDFSINVSDLHSGTASTPDDYTFTSPQTVTFHAGDSSSTKTVVTGIVNDDVSEGDETINLQLGTVFNASEGLFSQLSVGANKTHTVTITDDDIDLQVTKTASTDSVVAGSGAHNLTYTVTVKNTGLTNATGVTLGEDITLMPGVTIDSVTPSKGTFGVTASPDGTWTVGNLAPNESATFTVTATVGSSAAAGTDVIGDTATITHADQHLVNTGDDFASKTTSIARSVDLQLTKDDGVTSTTPGGDLTYTLNVSNPQPSDAKGVVLTEHLPAGTTFNAAGSTGGWVESQPGVFTMDLGTIAGGSTHAPIAFAVKVNHPVAAGLGTIVNNASIADDGSLQGDASPANNSATDTDTLDAAPDLHVSIADHPSTALRGGLVTYDITYGNAGTQDASGGFIKMMLPANTVFDSIHSNGAWSPIGGGMYQLDLGNVHAGDPAGTASFAVRVSSTLPVGFTALSATATIGDDGTNGLDLNSADNSASDTTPLYQGIYAVSNGVSLPGKHGVPQVLVYDIATGDLIHTIQPYESTYRDSVRIAVGDVNGDGYDDIITSTRTGSGHVRVFDGITGDRFEGVFSDLAAFAEKGARGAFVAAGDVNGDGLDDIIVGSGQGARGAGHVKVFSGATGALLSDFQPFSKGFKGGVRVATGDVNGDGLADIITSQGVGGNKVLVVDGLAASMNEVILEGQETSVLHAFEIGGAKYKGGVFVAAGDLDGDHKADLVVGRDRGKTVVEVFNGDTEQLMKTITPFAPKYNLGARVAVGDVNLDGIADIIVGSGGRNLSSVKVFSGADSSVLDTFQAFPKNPTGALFVAGSSPVPELHSEEAGPVNFPLYGPSGLVNVGAGSLTLSGANNYAGPSSIAGGPGLVFVQPPGNLILPPSNTSPVIPTPSGGLPPTTGIFGGTLLLNPTVPIIISPGLGGGTIHFQP